MHGAKPGVLPEELRKALGMGDNSPPPWLINMQRYGPPPSYPDLKVCPAPDFRGTEHSCRACAGARPERAHPAAVPMPGVLLRLVGGHAQVPGLSAPIPPGAQFGFQPGGWGKPPVDESGNPLYGDVFGQAMDDGDDDVRPVC